MSRVLRTAVRFALTAAMAAAVVLLAGLAVGPHLLAYRTLTMLTGSMTPTFPTGSVVVATPEPASALRPGQVLVYRIPVQDHRVVSHRVVSVTPAGTGLRVVTRGDANRSVDPWTAQIEDRSVYRARFAVPYVGRLIRVLRSPLVLLLVARVVPAGALAWFLLALWWPTRSEGDRDAAQLA